MTERQEYMQDFPGRLRAVDCRIVEGNPADPHGRRVGLLRDAADEIDTLRAERESLIAVLRKAREELYNAEYDTLVAEIDGVLG